MNEEQIQALWEDNWHLVGHRSELAAQRDFVHFQIGRQEVAVFNDGASVVAFDNRCPHRGTRIFDGNHGNERFVCRYHGWSYAKGKLFVAGKETFEHCAIAEADLNYLQTEWLGDFLFVSMRPRTGLNEQLAGTAEPLETISKAIASRYDFNAFTYECDWRISVENALEPYHVAGIHPNTLNTLNLQSGRNEYFGRNSIWYSGVGNERAGRMLKSLRRRFDLPYQFEGYVSIYLFPFTMLSSTYGYSYSLQNFFPSSAQEQTHFASRLLVSRLADQVKPELLASFFESSAALNRATFDEDHEICKRVPIDGWSEAPPRFWSTEEEKIVHFRRSFADFFAAGATAADAGLSASR
jgi:phenylpropionate dioxygenase-like ring-hydroxylating dioxygenase large terminal subunit